MAGTATRPIGLLFERQDRSAVEPLARSRCYGQAVLPQARLYSFGRFKASTRARDRRPTDCSWAIRIPLATREDGVSNWPNRAWIANRPSLRKVARPGGRRESAKVRLQAAYSLGESRDPLAAVDAIARIARRDGGDPWIRTAVLSSVAETSHELLIRLLAEPGFVASGTGAEIAERLAYIVGVRNRPDEMARLLDAVATLLQPESVSLQVTNRTGSIGDGLKRVNSFLQARKVSPIDRAITCCNRS